MIRRLGLGLALLPVLVILLAALILAFAQTSTGKRLIAGQLERALTTPETRIELGELSGFVPFDLRLSRLVVADREGKWLEMQDARLAWSPAALLERRLRVEELSAAAVEIARLPPFEADDEPDTEPFRLPELPESIPPVTVDRLAIERLVLGAPVLGAAATFALDGRLTAPPDGRSAALALDLRRLDEASAAATLAATLHLDPPALDLDLSAQETGGLLAAATGQPQAGDLTLRLAGAGPLEAWQGELQVEAERLVSAQADLRLALVERPRLELAASIDPVAGWLPAEVAPLIGERLTLTLDLTQTGAQQVTIAALRATAAAADLTAEGELDLDADTLQADARLRVPDLARLSTLADLQLAGELSVHLVAEGGLRQPSGRIELRAQGLMVDELTAARLETAFDYTALAPLDAPEPGIELAGHGRVARLVAPVEGLPAQNLDWQLRLRAPPGDPVQIEQLALTADLLKLTGRGEIDPRTWNGQASLALIVDALGPLAAPFGVPLEGQGELSAEVTIARAERIDAELSGGLGQLAGLPPGATELIGSELRFAASVQVEPEQGIEISDLTLNGEAATLGGQLAFGLPEQSLEGRLQLRLPRLSVLAPVVEQDLAGALALDATLAGTLAAPEVELAATGQDLVLAGQPVSALAVQATAKGPPDAVAGAVRIGVTASGVRATLDTPYRLRGETLVLSDIVLRAPRTELDGALSVDLERWLLDGRLSGQVIDLAGLNPLMPVAVRGRLELELRAQPEADSQELAAVLRASQLRSELGRAAEVAARATLADAWRAPRLDLTVTGREFTQEVLHLDNARVTAQGALDQLALTIAADGRAVQPFDLEAGAQLALDAAVRLRVERLTGQVAGAGLRLAQPLDVTWAGETLRLAGLDLRLADARLTGDLALDPQTVSAQARLETLPLALLGRFGAPPLNGRAAATLRLSGAVDNPHGTLDLTVTDLRAADPALADLPPVTLAGQAELGDRRLGIALWAEGLTDEPMELDLGLPVLLQLRPGVLEIPDDGALNGRLGARLQLARLADYLALDDQRLAGDLNAALRLAGTVGAPLVDGSVTVADGLYENATTGTVLRSLVLDARAAGRQITIARLTATDGANGRVSVTGTIDVDPAAEFPLDLQLTMETARLVARDDVTATTSGQLRVAGTLADALLAGQIVVNRAEIRIPDRLGPDVAVIEVEEIGGERTEEPQPNGGLALELRLDLTIDAPGQIFVTGRGLQSEWEGDLTVQGSADAPTLAGQLRVRRGVLDLTYRRLELVEGEITLTGATPPDPSLNVVAETQVDEVRVRVRVDRTVSDPRFALESEPPLPEDEVMARLIFGRDISQIGPVEAAQLAMAVNQLRGGGGGLDVLGRIRSALGVDVLDVRSGEQPGEATVRAGRYLNEDVFVEVEGGGAEQSGRARVEIEILPNLSLEADTGQDARSGVGLKWKFDY